MNIKSWLFEEDEKPAGVPSPVLVPQPVVYNNPNFVPADKPLAENKYVARLITAIDDGSSYMQLSKVLNATPEIAGLSMQARVSMVFAMLKATNPTLTKQQLIETADTCLKKLDGEYQVFMSEVATRTDTQVGKNQTSITEKTELAKAKQAEIDKLQAEINQLSIDVQTAQAKIATSTNDFTVAVQTIKGEIEQNKQIITNNIA